jgi:transglutaminase-like putative cysteine protease
VLLFLFFTEEYKTMSIAQNLHAILFTTVILFVGCETKPTEEKTVGKTSKVTIQDVEKGIRASIDQRTEEGNGYFKFMSDTLDLNLKLVRVHTEYLSVLGPKEFFACVDLATENGDVYDVDFFLTGTAGNMEVTREKLHKLNGKPYYTWKQAEDKTWYTVPFENASNELMGVIEDEDQFTFNYEIQLPDISSEGRMWVPLAQSDRFQEIEIISVIAPVEYRIIEDAEFGNKIMYLELLKEHGQEVVSISYQVKRKEKAPYVAEENDLNRYLLATPLLPVGDRFGTIANDAIMASEANSPLTKARALYDYIIDNMRYAKEGTYGTGDANYACDARSGNCTEFHSFFISLARSAGIPARFAVGAAIPSERNEGGVDGYHCWAEFFAEGKWWPVDISEANKYTPLATYYFGHHSANRLELSRGRDIRPEPAPESGPINFLAYPVLEINGIPVYTETNFTFARQPEADI